MAMAAALAAGMPAAATSAWAGGGIEDGIAAWKAGDAARAVAIWRPLADGGDTDAQFNLGQAYRLGRGVGADGQAALRWYGMAAAAGHAQATANYGLMLFERGDRQTAMPWVRKAADAGDPRALYVLATSLFNGDLMPRDQPLAYAYMTRAAAAKLPPAIDSLAQMDRMLGEDVRRRGLAIASARAETPVRPASLVTTAAALSRPTLPPTIRPAPGRWRVQLGAFATAAQAQAHWPQFAGTLGEAQRFVVQAGPVVRLQAGPFATRAEANRACSAVAAAGRPCFPVTP